MSIFNKLKERKTLNKRTRDTVIKNELDNLSISSIVAIAHAIVGYRRDCLCIGNRLPKELIASYRNILKSINTQQDFRDFIAEVDLRIKPKNNNLTSKGEEFKAELSKLCKQIS